MVPAQPEGPKMQKGGGRAHPPCHSASVMFGRSTFTATFISDSSDEVQVVCADFSATPGPERLSEGPSSRTAIEARHSICVLVLRGIHPGARSDQTVSSC